VLDVEGRAGQVLRGCGVDIDRLRAALDSSGRRPRPAAKSGRSAADPACQRCSATLAGSLRYHRMAATGAQGPRDVVVISCANCGSALSAFPPRPLNARE
jgi:hypothetical protein